MLCSLWSLGAIVRHWAWTSNVGDLSPRCWTTRELPTQWNINWQELSQRFPSQHQDHGPPNSQQAPKPDASHQIITKTGTQPCPLADRLPTDIASPQISGSKHNNGNSTALQRHSIQLKSQQHRH